MGAAMASTPKPPPHDRRLARAFAAAFALLALASAITWGGPSVARAAQPASTSALSAPASAKAQAPSTTAGTATASTPTTTYAPSGGASVPGSSPAAGASTATIPPAASTPATSTPVTPSAIAAAPKSAAQGKAGTGDRPLSTGAIVIAVLAALLVLACAAWALARSSAFEPHWLLLLRHAMAEAGFRASATWSEFADWARLGR
jgi:hypothetical protein